MNSKLANDVLKNKSKPIETLEQADVVIAHLENVLSKTKHVLISAPEVDVLKQVAIIRSPTYSINLINTKIVERKNQILSLREFCFSFENQFCNCLRYNDITIKNDLDNKKIKLSGSPAFLVQHAIDHFDGFLLADTNKIVRLALARKDGSLMDNDFCPCASKKRFILCCKKK